MYFTETPGTFSRERAPRLRFRVLRWLAARLPCRPILVEGAPYLERYYLAGPLPLEVAALWPVGNRPTPAWTWLRRTWYLHRFYRPDAERDLHDHPWDARGRILAGAYLEHLPGQVWRVKREGDKTHVTPGGYHRIAKLMPSLKDPPEVWTLLRCGPYTHRWGYLVGGEHVPHADYHAVPPKRGRVDAGVCA